MTQITINSHSKESCRKSLVDAISMSNKLAAMSPGAKNTVTGTASGRTPIAFIIDGTSFVYILETELEEELFKVATACDVVLCCRVAPLQKAGIVALEKNRTDDMTLAIGDGANDVSMIQMADVGIRISGQEERQAVMASDFAMGQFRFLMPLLLVHGHWNYQRMAYMILYNFYRNVIFVFMLFWEVEDFARRLNSDWPERMLEILSINQERRLVPNLINGNGSLRRYTGREQDLFNAKGFMYTIVLFIGAQNASSVQPVVPIE